MKAASLLAFAVLFAAGTAHAQQQPTPPRPVASAPTASKEVPGPPPVPASATELECRVLTGRVTDAMNQPLTGATVILRSRTKGFNVDAFITNAEGQYIVTSKQPIPRNTMLEISAGGYTTYVLPLENCRPIEASLEPLPGTRFKSNGRIKKTSASGKIH